MYGNVRGQAGNSKERQARLDNQVEKMYKLKIREEIGKVEQGEKEQDRKLKNIGLGERGNLGVGGQVRKKLV